MILILDTAVTLAKSGKNALSEADVYQLENPTGNSEITFPVLIHSSPLQMHKSYGIEAKEMKKGLDWNMEESNRLPWLTW